MLEEKVLLRYKEKDIIVRLKGVSDSYAKMVNFKNNFFSGEYLNQNKNDNDVIVGRGISKALKIPILKKNDVDPFQQINKSNPIPRLIIPDREKKIGVIVLSSISLLSQWGYLIFTQILIMNIYFQI